MFRRLLACLVALTIAAPSIGLGAVSVAAPTVAEARQAAADCACPLDKSDCADKVARCACGVACLIRLAAEPTASAAPAPLQSAALRGASPVARSTLPSGPPSDAPFRPPRSTIPN